MRILIIEDSDSIRRMLQALVSARADEVVAVATGADGLDKAFRQMPDLVLLDLNLPGIYNGFEVCARLRADPKTRSVPIIIVSARTDDESRRRALNAGASAYFTKPFSPTALLKEIDATRRRSSGEMHAVKAGAGSSSLAPPRQPSLPSPHPQGSSTAPPASPETQPRPGSDPHRRR
jgi:DNA-binding response OmpR family regulator